MKSLICITLFACVISVTLILPARSQTSARVEVSQTSNTWSYTLFNEEPIGSPHYLSAFYLQVSASITVTGTPNGWIFDTDFSNFVFWFNLDDQLPYPNDVAPGMSLSGFQISSSAPYSVLHFSDIGVWDHFSDLQADSVSGQVFSPSSTVAAPEPGSLTFGLLGLAGLAIPLWLRTGRTYRSDQRDQT